MRDQRILAVVNILALAFLAHNSALGQTSGTSRLCSSRETSLQWILGKKPIESKEVQISLSRFRTGENHYAIHITPECDGVVSVEAHEHGFRVTKERILNGECVPAPQDTQAASRGQEGKAECVPDRGEEVNTGASLRVMIDGPEVCRLNDGSLTPPVPGITSKSNFNNYNFACVARPNTSLTYNLKKGTETIVELLRWNTNASPDADVKDGFRFEVVFRPK